MNSTPICTIHNLPKKLVGIKRQRWVCRQCALLMERRSWQRLSPARQFRRRLQRVSKIYDIEIADWVAAWSRQDGKCASCEKTRVKLHTDHDHITGRFRALLCYGCNTALGALKDESKRIEQLLRYRQQFEE